MRKLDIGYVLGLGYQLSDDFNLGLRYKGSFGRLYATGDSNVRNSALQIQLGYWLPSR